VAVEVCSDEFTISVKLAFDSVNPVAVCALCTPGDIFATLGHIVLHWRGDAPCCANYVLVRGLATLLEVSSIVILDPETELEVEAESSNKQNSSNINNKIGGCDQK